MPRRCELTTFASKTLPLQGSAGFSSPQTLCPARSPASCQPSAELRKKRPIKPAGEVGGRLRAPGREAHQSPRSTSQPIVLESPSCTSHSPHKRQKRLLPPINHYPEQVTWALSTSCAVGRGLGWSTRLDRVFQRRARC